MEWPNYHHLFYFWMVAREGSIVRASEELKLTQPTISAQIRIFEESLGKKLFTRQGRGLALTDVGRMVYRYADDIFSLGREMVESLQDRPTERPTRLRVGVANVVSKLVASRILEPALKLQQKISIVVHEDTPERLLAQLAMRELDVVLSDVPAGAAKVKVFSHLLGECGVTFFATAEEAARLKRGFPRSLNGINMLLPSLNVALRRNIDTWLETNNVRPIVAGEFDDSALMEAFGQSGAGVFPAPTAVEKHVVKQHNVVPIGRVPTLAVRFYAISSERKMKNPAVLAISNAARSILSA